MSVQNPHEEFAVAMARRTLIQGIPFSMKGAAEHQKVAAALRPQVIELAKGFTMTRAQAVEGLMSQQALVAEDIRSMWPSEGRMNMAADQFVNKSSATAPPYAPRER